MSELRDFVRKKRQELEVILGPLMDRQDRLKSELRSVSQEIAHLIPQLEELNKVASTLGLGGEPTPPKQEPAKSTDVTIKEAIRLTLDVNSGGLTSHELFERINEEYFAGALKRESFSPQLSRMKRDGQVFAENNVWGLTIGGKKAITSNRRFSFEIPQKENEPSDAPTSDGSDAGSEERQFQ